MQGDEQLLKAQQASFLKSFSLQIRAMSALSIRFIMTRYGRANVGFLWVILEPMILCVGVMLLWSVLKGSYDHGVQVIAFVFTGYMPLTLQRHMSNCGIFILRLSKSTLIHSNITYYDNLISRILLEFIATSAAALVIYLILTSLNIIDNAYDFGQVLLGWFLMACIATGMAFIYAGLSEAYEVAEKFLPAFNYLMLPLCGFFFMVEWLPYRVQELALYFPLVHAFESVRSGMFGPSVITHYSLSYAFLSAFLMISIGVMIINRVRDRI